MLDLETLFRPATVGIIGASDKNPWSGIAARALANIGYVGRVHLINRRGTPALGRDTLLSCADAEGGIDAAFVAVPAAHMRDALDDMAAGGVKFGAVVTSGFAEVGPTGAMLQQEMVDQARSLGITLLGPNSLGFTNMVDRIALGAMPLPSSALPNPRVSLVSQSGATAVLIAQAAHQFNVSLAHVIAMGNEAMVDLADVVRFLVADRETRAICVFAEAIRSPDAFLEAAEMAFRAKKPIVMLKVGVGELTATVAQAHTGALVGDDRIFQAMCDAFNIIRVNSMEDLILTADLLAAVGPVDPVKGFALASISGGACEIMSDRGEENGIPFPQFDESILQRLSEVLADFGSAHNPLDLTGAAMANPKLYSDVLRILGESGQYALLGVVGGELPSEGLPDSAALRSSLAEIGAGLRAPGVTGVLIQQTLKPVTESGRKVLAESGVPLASGGLDHASRAIGKLWSWSRGLNRRLPRRFAPNETVNRPVGEYETLRWLRSQNVPVIPQTLAATRDEAIACANALGGAVVLKICAPGIAHKTEIGGVLLNLVGAEAVGRGYDQILENVARGAPGAAIDGVLVSPMRGGGQELIVGIARDPSWGLVLAIGMGGIWVELLGDSQLRLLPVELEDVVEALTQLKAAKLLTGYRGSKPADLDRVAAAVVAICTAAAALGDDLEALEINPLRVDGDQVEALDALAVWRR